MKYVFIRHGETVSNRQGTFSGVLDVALSDVGIKQAQSLCEYLINNYRFDKIYSSPLSRAKNTVKTLAEKTGLKIITDELLKEIFGGKWEGLKMDEIIRLYPEDMANWKKDMGNSRCTEGESFFDVQKRAYEFLRKTAADSDDTVLVATHAGVIRSLVCGLKNLPIEKIGEINWVSNASITEILYENGKFTLGKIGYNEFLTEITTLDDKF